MRRFSPQVSDLQRVKTLRCFRAVPQLTPEYTCQKPFTCQTSHFQSTHPVRCCAEDNLADYGQGQ